MGNNCCDKASKNSKDIDTNTQDIATLKASMPDGSSQSQTYVTKDYLDGQIQALSKRIDTAQGPTLKSITSVIQNDPGGQIANAITSTLGKSFVTKGTLGLDNSENTLTFDGNMVLKCSGGSGQACLTVNGPVNTKDVQVQDGTLSMYNSKSNFTNFNIKSDPNGENTILTMGSGSNTLKLMGDLELGVTESKPDSKGNVTHHGGSVSGYYGSAKLYGLDTSGITAAGGFAYTAADTALRVPTIGGTNGALTVNGALAAGSATVQGNITSGGNISAESAGATITGYYLRTVNGGSGSFESQGGIVCGNGAQLCNYGE